MASLKCRTPMSKNTDTTADVNIRTEDKTKNNMSKGKNL